MLYLPFAVDDHFVPFGFLESQSALALASDVNECAPRPEGAQGECHRYDYVAPTEGWAGLYWLSTYDNWGELPGNVVEPGAERVSFRAGSVPDGAPVTFIVGGLDSGDSTLPYKDTLPMQSLKPDLVKGLQAFEIDLTGADYQPGVLGGFGFIIESTDNYTIYVDDIRWE
jgi:hypothetical protein